MAKGILMQRGHLTDERAFDLLAGTSQKANIKVHYIAAWLVARIRPRTAPGAKPLRPPTHSSQREKSDASTIWPSVPHT